MMAKCDKCSAAFELDESVSRREGGELLCPKCELEIALGAGVESDVAEAMEPPIPIGLRIIGGLLKLMKNPIVIFITIVAAVLFGLNYETYSKMLKPIGDIYLNLLKMCVFPILITAVITSVGKLFASKEASAYIVRILVVFMVLLLLTSFAGLGISMIWQPGKGLSQEARETLGKTLTEDDTGGGLAGEEQERGIVGFIQSVIPENIFSALDEGYSLQILFFALILGIATGFLPEIEGRLILSFSESLFKAFFGIIGWILYLLPIGLFCLVSSQVAYTGMDILKAMTKFVAAVWILSLLVIVANAIIIWYATGFSPLRSFTKLKDCLLIGFGTQSTFASIPSQLDGLQALKVNAELANLVVPIGAVICRFSMVILYSAAVVFAAQLYDVDLTMGNLIMALFLAVVASFAGAGTPGLVSIALVAIVLNPLGLPSAAIITLLLAINPVIEPVTTLANVHANCAATTLVAKGMTPA